MARSNPAKFVYSFVYCAMTHNPIIRKITPQQAVIIALLTLSSLSSALPALAGIFKDDKDNVYVTDTDATALGAEATLGYVGTPMERKVRAGYCGEIRISPTSSVPSVGNSFTIGGTTYNAASSPVDDNAKCSGNTLDPAPAGTIWKDSQGRIYITDAFTAGIRYEVIYDDVDLARTRRPNQCGFYKISNTSSNPLPATIDLAGTTYTIASLPVQNPPLCRKGINGAYVQWDPQ